jgi:hypothetical protein
MAWPAGVASEHCKPSLHGWHMAGHTSTLPKVVSMLDNTFTAHFSGQPTKFYMVIAQGENNTWSESWDSLTFISPFRVCAFDSRKHASIRHYSNMHCTMLYFIENGWILRMSSNSHVPS